MSTTTDATAVMFLRQLFLRRHGWQIRHPVSRYHLSRYHLSRPAAAQLRIRKAANSAATLIASARSAWPPSGRGGRWRVRATAAALVAPVSCRARPSLLYQMYPDQIWPGYRPLSCARVWLALSPGAACCCGLASVACHDSILPHAPVPPACCSSRRRARPRPRPSATAARADGATTPPLSLYRLVCFMLENPHRDRARRCTIVHTNNCCPRAQACSPATPSTTPGGCRTTSSSAAWTPPYTVRALSGRLRMIVPLAFPTVNMLSMATLCRPAVCLTAKTTAISGPRSPCD